MSENIQPAFAFGEAHGFAYASMYAIQLSPITNHEEDGVYATFLTKDGTETCWPCRAKWFDEPEEALAKLWTIKRTRFKGADGLTYPRVVKLELGCKIQAVSLAMRNETRREQEIA